MGEQLSAGHFRIVDYSVDTKSGSTARFVRRPEHHREALEAFFQKTGANYSRFNYLGEWHSHPCFPARPSDQDMSAMLALVEEEDGIPFSVLLIVKTRWYLNLEFSALLFQRGGFIGEVRFV
jgi:[CysO sulfur-carrier protein]-S-L-cysteine hydrolase